MMTIIRAIEIENFRCIKELSWFPNAGVNCIIGSGDSGKTSLLDAIDYCIGARRSLPLTDADFYRLDHTKPIKITITLGELSAELKNIDSYGLYLHGFNSLTSEIEDEPGRGLETVLTVQLTVEGDLESRWNLVSARAEAQGQTKNLSWKDRTSLAPTRLGAANDSHLSWRRSSILNKLTDERADASTVLAEATRAARATFGEQANAQLGTTLEIVNRTATSLGVPVGNRVNAMLDAGSVSYTGGMISLHDEYGVPLVGLGLGSTRLLVAGLQREAAENASIILIDELEHGLEPHRIIGLLNALGAKEEQPPLQVFMTSHSPVAVRELSGSQLNMLRVVDDIHSVKNVGKEDDIQGTIRLFPEALLARSILVCEGASEVGLIRGLDQHRREAGSKPLTAYGVVLVDGGGDAVFRRACAFQKLGYRVAVLRDSDVLPTPELEQSFTEAGGDVFCWEDDNALEDELFLSLSDDAVENLLNLAIELKDEMLVDAHIRTASADTRNLNDIQTEILVTGLSDDIRTILGKAARQRDSKKSWFKSVSAMETAGHDIIAPSLATAAEELSNVVGGIFDWIGNAP